MQLKLQLEDQVTELRSRVQELEAALATARQEHSELTEQYKVGVRAGMGWGLDPARGERKDVSGVLRWSLYQGNRLEGNR